MFDKIDTVMDEGLLCATVILRLLEKLDGMLTVTMCKCCFKTTCITTYLMIIPLTFATL